MAFRSGSPYAYACRRMAESALQVGLRWFDEVWRQHKTESIIELLAHDAKGHMEGGLELVGVDGFVAFHQNIMVTFPDLTCEVLKAMEDGEQICILWDASAHHLGNGFGFAAAGKAVSFRGMTWFRVKEGKIVEGWDCWNQARLFSTLSDVILPRVY